MNLRFALILGAGIIFSFMAIFIAVFSVLRGPEKVLIEKTDENFRENLIPQKKFAIPLPPPQEYEQESTKLELSPTPKKIPQFKKPERQLKLTTVTKKADVPAVKKGSDIATTTPPVKFSEKDAQKIIAELVSSSATSTSQMPAPIPTATSPLTIRPSDQEIFEKLWPKEYLAHLRLVEEKMIQEGFKDASDKNNFATNEDVFKFLDSTVAYLFAGKLFTANEAISLQNVLHALSATINSPTFTFDEPPSEIPAE